jgi:hypothetical protein
MARSWLSEPVVNVRPQTWLIASMALIGGLMPSIAEAPDLTNVGRKTSTVVTDERLRLDWPVRIEEQLVRVDAARTPPDQARTMAQHRSVRRRYARDDAESVMSRARRFLLGDGEARPEPFPRPR